MSIADTIVGILPAAFAGVKAIADLISPRARIGAEFAEEIVTFIIGAERDGLSTEKLLEGVGDLYVDLVQKLKTGVT